MIPLITFIHSVLYEFNGYQFLALRNEQFFEVYIGYPSVNNSGDPVHISSELMWDLINIAFIGCKKEETEPEVLKSVEGDIAGYEITEEILNISCKITSMKKHGNPIEELFHETAWTQPVQYLK